MALLFVYVVIYIFDPILSKRKEFKNSAKENDTNVKKLFLFKQKGELELDLDIGNINLDQYEREKVNLDKELKLLDLKRK